jgi:hypothetical protein
VGINGPEDEPASSDEPRSVPRTRQPDRPLGDPSKQPGDELLGVPARLIVGAVFAVLYISTFGPRTGWLPAVVSGLLGAAVIFLLLKEVDERRKRRRRRR